MIVNSTNGKLIEMIQKPLIAYLLEYVLAK